MSAVPASLLHASVGAPTFRRLIGWISRRCLGWYYREHRVHVTGAGELPRALPAGVPPSGAVLLIGNHPNDLPDVLLGYLTTDRPVRYLATVSAATSWPARKTYEGLAVIPVLRVQDVRKMRAAGADVAGLNRDAAAAVARAFGEGAVIGAFPEGGVRDQPGLGAFRTGVATMALQAIETGAVTDVTVVPFGLQYEAPRTPGSDVLTVLGPPWSLRQWLEAQHAALGADGPRTAVALTAAFAAAVRAITRNSATVEAAAIRDRLVAAYAAGLSPGDPLSRVAEVVPAAERIAESPGIDAVRCRTAADRLAVAVERAGGIGTSAADHARLLHALDVTPLAAPVPDAVLWMGLPAAGIGWLAHGPLWLAIHLLAKRLAKVPADLVMLHFVPGLYLAVAWYLFLAAGLGSAAHALGVSALWALPAVAILPRFGDLARSWQAWFRAWRLVRTAHRWSTPERAALRDAAATLRASWVAAAQSLDEAPPPTADGRRAVAAATVAASTVAVVPPPPTAPPEPVAASSAASSAARPAD